jgi:hypothetical protein
VFPVADVAAAIDWHRRVFGFEPRLVNPPGDEVPVYAILYRDAVGDHAAAARRGQQLVALSPG